MKRTALFITLTIIGLCYTLQAQNEFRIRQTLPAEIDSLVICPGWQVRINQGFEASLSIVTSCQAFYDDNNEPEVCRVEGRCLTLLKNSNMPKSTVLEITLAAPIRNLEIDRHSNVTTGRLKFASYTSVSIEDSAKVQGTSWLFDRTFISISPGASLCLDSITGGRRVHIHQWGTSNLECPVILSPDTEIKRSRNATGTPYQTDSTIHMIVKKGCSYHNRQLTLNAGVTAPIPLYMNNTSGSPYNRGENYRITIQMGLNPISLAKRLSVSSYLIYEWDWSRLLNSVQINGNSLVLDNSVGAERPQQHLLGQNIGYDFNFNYRIGEKNTRTGDYPLTLSFGMAALYNISGRLATRTMGTDNRWHRTNEKVDVFNPWQLRLHASIGGGPLTRAKLGLSYDLLPTFRSGIGADKVHTFGISISF